MSFDWRTEWSAFRVAHVRETAKKWLAWDASDDWGLWDEYGADGHRVLEDQFALVFLAQDEAMVELLRDGLQASLAARAKAEVSEDGAAPS